MSSNYSRDDGLPSLTSLRIDETQSSGSASTYNTPCPSQRTADQENVNETEDWLAFSTEVDMTPPIKITKSIAKVIEIADGLLLTCSDRSWTSLLPEQKAQMAFMINEDFHNLFSSYEEAASEMTKAIFARGPKGKVFNRNLEAFTRKGGDKIFGSGQETDEEGGAAKYQEFINKYRFWKDTERSATIFSMAPHVTPLLRFQEPDSMACSPVHASIIVHYTHKCRLEGTEDEVTISEQETCVEVTASQFGMNVCRFMRNALDSLEKFNYAFKASGFPLSNMLERILKPGNPTKDILELIIAEILSWEIDKDELYKTLKGQLRKGPLFTDRFRLYEEYGSCDTCVSEGEKSYTGAFHAITIIGVSRTSDEKDGGIMFSVQDSDCVHPFKNVGLSLLLQMQIPCLFRLFPVNIDFPTYGAFDTDTKFACSFSEGDPPLSTIEPAQVDIAEWKKDGGGLEQWLSYTRDDFVPSWTRSKRQIALYSDILSEQTSQPTKPL
jgi:hypothetical protein